MNLDDIKNFSNIDKENMYDNIFSLPEQFETAWSLVKNTEFPAFSPIKKIIVSGMGGSAIGADLLLSYIERTCGVPFFVNRNYGLPAWAKGDETLVITSSHSGNTEETLSAFEQALENKCQILAVCTGGKLEKQAKENSVPVLKFDHKGQPRAAVGYSFGLLLGILTKLGLIADPEKELLAMIDELRQQRLELAKEVTQESNPAKKLALEIKDHWVVVMGADLLTPVSRRWKGQISEIAKAWAQFEFLPEADHNTLAGVVNPGEVLAKTAVVFLQASSDHERNQFRSLITRNEFEKAGIQTYVFEAKGTDNLSQIWTTLHFGDFLAYYLALSYGADPTPVDAIENLKVAMKA